MYFTGYHGTSKESADGIIKDGGFLISKGDKQWLGDGVYFYPDFNDAINWKYNVDDSDVEAVLHAIVEVEDDEFLDLDETEGQAIFDAVHDELAESAGVESKGLQENQNVVCKEIWKKTSQLRLMAGSFPTKSRVLPTLTDTRKLRREFCIRDNSCIVYLNKIERSEIS